MCSRSSYSVAAVALAACFLVTGCAKKEEGEPTASAGKIREAGAPSPQSDWVHTDDATAEQRGWLEYARSLVQAVADRDYAAFYNQLSSYAKAGMSLNQFAPEDEDAAFEQHEKQPLGNITEAQFLELMKNRMEARYGLPFKPQNLYLHSADPSVLAGAKREGLDGVDVMFAIGNMPATVPAASRRASLRAQVAVELTPVMLEEVAKAYNISPDELVRGDDFHPYLNLKLVLVDDADGQLRVGYFEFLLPSMLD